VQLSAEQILVGLFRADFFASTSDACIVLLGAFRADFFVSTSDACIVLLGAALTSLIMTMEPSSLFAAAMDLSRVDVRLGSEICSCFFAATASALLRRESW
jgi:hypothetical protein